MQHLNPTSSFCCFGQAREAVISGPNPQGPQPMQMRDHRVQISKHPTERLEQFFKDQLKKLNERVETEIALINTNLSFEERDLVTIDNQIKDDFQAEENAEYQKMLDDQVIDNIAFYKPYMKGSAIAYRTALQNVFSQLDNAGSRESSSTQLL
ncbi:MAG: hypothetical protein JSS32_08980 [Verrucomicrobia bacterium]|nr:hypothetical protein [Verrucomicrobiota bacterium]